MVVVKLSVIYMVLVLSTSTTLSDNYVDERIVNGFTATPGQFPYQALLEILKPSGLWLCGGSLLNNEWVITAGHCSDRAIEFKVTLGALSFDDVSEPGRLTDRTKIKFLHPSYSSSDKPSIHDLSLVKLSKKIDLTDRIQPIRLPKSDDSFADSAVIASGWGFTQTHGQRTSQLQWASMKIITNYECGLIAGWLMYSSMICAQGNRKESTCYGDSGGPIVLQSDNRTLVGVTSFLLRSSCDLGIPQVFARITSHRQWIKEVTGIDST